MVDHLSGYLAISSDRILKNCIIGDYTVNMGQGLIQWQGYSMGPSNQPYNYFSKKVNNYKNTCIDVETNIPSGFLFGEVALDGKLNSGFIVGKQNKT